MDFNVGLAIQCVGILLVTLLSLFMRRSLHSQALNYWIAAWSSLSLALLNLFIGFRVTTYQTVFYSLYFLGEYMFGLLFIAGCRHYVSGRGIERKDFLLLVPAFILAVCLPYLSKDFNDLFMVHTTMIAGFFATSFIVLWKGTRGARANPGVQVMFASLIYLTIDYLHYVPVFGARKGALGFTVPAVYLQYTSIFDLVFEILLCFGTVMVLMEGVRQEVERVNRRLLKARDRLQILAQMDPLTEALNRHAFHSLLSGSEDGNETTSSGCVALLDIDNLKPINDTLGHTAGDKAIRAVARAMRSLIRADDMLFRWGGDEFLVLMFKLPEEEASRRIRSLNEILERHCREWTGLPITVSVSYGVAGFDLLRNVSDAIERADHEMYKERQRSRSEVCVQPPVLV